MLRWFKAPETIHFLDYIAEVQENLIRKLVTQPKEWRTSPKGDSAVREDISDVVRGQVLAFEDLLKTEKVLRQGLIKEAEAQLAMEQK